MVRVFFFECKGCLTMTQAPGGRWGRLGQPCQRTLGQRLGQGGWGGVVQNDAASYRHVQACTAQQCDNIQNIDAVIEIDMGYVICQKNLIIKSSSVGMNMERTLLMIGLFKVTIATRPAQTIICTCMKYTNVILEEYTFDIWHKF